MNKKKIIWAILFVFIAAFSIWAVTAQSKNFSVTEFLSSIKSARLEWILMAVICMICYIMFEGLAVLCISKSFGFKRKLRNGFVYSAADIYFSAITPSATGGQPASAFFMIKDKIPPVYVTVILMVNLIMYNLALLSVGLFSLAAFPAIYMRFDFLARIFMVIGYVVLLGLSFMFFMLLKKEKILYSIMDCLMRVMCRLHLMHNLEKRQQKLYKTRDDFKLCIQMIEGKGGMLISAFLCNLLQRVFLITITLCCYFALHGVSLKGVEIWITQCFASVGSNSVPIPGSMGVADFLMLNGFGKIMGNEMATNLELLSRSLSFYTCVVLSGVTILIGYILRRYRRCYK